MDLQLDGHVAIVTGASRGLGAAAVRALVDERARVVAAARSTGDLERLASSAPEAIEVAQCDMRDRRAVADLVGVALARFGRLDSVVNNAGVAPAARFLDQDDAALDGVLAVNLVAPAVLSKAAARHWVETRQPGSIVNIASTAGLRGKPLLAAYAASKAGLVRMTEALAGEWARHGIRVNAIAPGDFVTAAQAAVLADPDLMAARLRKIPARRMADPDELGPLVCYLASPVSDFVTGSCFVIDGGEVGKL